MIPAGFYGFDVYYDSWLELNEPAVISNDPSESEPSLGNPLMGYQSPKWIDPYDYCKLLDGYGVPCDVNQLQVFAGHDNDHEHASLASTQIGNEVVSLQIAPDEYLLVSGIINRDSEEAIFYQVARTKDPRPHLVAEAEERRRRIEAEGLTSLYTLVLVDGSGNVLLEQPLVSLEAPPHEGVPSHQLFLELTAFPIEATAVRIQSQGRVLVQRNVSPNAPQVELLVPNGGEILTAPFEIRWEARDADGDPLTFSVLYSPDNGATWRALRIGGTSNNLVLDNFGALAGSEEALFRVVANDGINTGV